MDLQRLRKRFFDITVWKHGGLRAPHKPLLALYAIGRMLRGDERLISYSEVDRDLKKLLVEFGPIRQSYHPEYPFWRLQNDGIWELQNAEKVEIRKSSTDAKKSELLRYDVKGGFTQEIFSQISGNRSILKHIVADLLDENFPSSIHEDILQAVGIYFDRKRPALKRRDAQFREKVLRAYEYRCVVCGYDVRVGDSLVGLEAAHIKWYQAGGPDAEINGLALCALHHKLFDRGAFTLSDSMKIEVSERAHGSTGFTEWLMAFNGRQLRPPQRPTYYPEAKFIAWHVREVFQAPSRFA